MKIDNVTEKDLFYILFLYFLILLMVFTLAIYAGSDRMRHRLDLAQKEVSGSQCFSVKTACEANTPPEGRQAFCWSLNLMKSMT